MPLVSFLVGRGERDKAKTAVAEAERKLPKNGATRALAYCYDLIGDPERAKKL